MAYEELCKRQGCDEGLVAQYQKQADILLARIKLAPGDIQYHEVCAVLSGITCLIGYLCIILAQQFLCSRA